MNIRALQHLGAVAALAGAMLSASVANASIVAGSEVQLVGSARITDAAGGYTITSNGFVTVSPFGGNRGSWAGYNQPNPGMYNAPAMAPISNALIPVSPLITLPAVMIGVSEPGPAVASTTFSLETWQVVEATIGGFFLGRGTGTIFDTSDGTSTPGRFQFSTQFYLPNDINAFSASIVAIPVPGAMWIFGSGLLLMTAVMRRKVK